jgi:hypothetical protein
MSWTKAFASIPSLPFSSPVNSLAFVGIVIVSYFAVSAILFAVENFRVFVLARTFPGLFGLNLKTFGLWAGKAPVGDTPRTAALMNMRFTLMYVWLENV